MLPSLLLSTESNATSTNIKKTEILDTRWFKQRGERANGWWNRRGN